MPPHQTQQIFCHLIFSEESSRTWKLNIQDHLIHLPGNLSHIRPGWCASHHHPITTPAWQIKSRSSLISLFCSQKNFNLDPCYRQAFVGSQTWRQFAGRKLLTRTGPSIHYKQAVVGSETWRQFARSKSAALTNPQVLLSTLRKVGERMSQMTFMLSLRL